MNVQGFLADHLNWLVGLTMLALNCTPDWMLDTWHYLVAVASLFTFVAYLLAVDSGATQALAWCSALAAGVWWLAWHYRPRRLRLDGSHEAL